MISVFWLFPQLFLFCVYSTFSNFVVLCFYWQVYHSHVVILTTLSISCVVRMLLAFLGIGMSCILLLAFQFSIFYYFVMLIVNVSLAIFPIFFFIVVLTSLVNYAVFRHSGLFLCGNVVAPQASSKTLKNRFQLFTGFLYIFSSDLCSNWFF